MRYKVYANSIKLIGSCYVSRIDFSKELQRIRNLHPNLELWKRSDRALKCEWATHNLCYNLGIKRDRTADVDLNFKHKWYMNLAYWIVGNIALLVIK